MDYKSLLPHVFPKWLLPGPSSKRGALVFEPVWICHRKEGEWGMQVALSPGCMSFLVGRAGDNHNCPPWSPSLEMTLGMRGRGALPAMLRPGATLMPTQSQCAVSPTLPAPLPGLCTPRPCRLRCPDSSPSGSPQDPGACVNGVASFTGATLAGQVAGYWGPLPPAAKTREGGLVWCSSIHMWPLMP